MEDNYWHPADLAGVFYVSSNVPGKGCENGVFDTGYQGCQCHHHEEEEEEEIICHESTCLCTKDFKSGYNDSGKLADAILEVKK